MLTEKKFYGIILIESEVNVVVEIIDFVLMNAKSIVSYKIIDYSLGFSVVEFTMVNGERIQKDF